jgi:hypothetical protein
VRSTGRRPLAGVDHHHVDLPTFLDQPVAGRVGVQLVNRGVGDDHCMIGRRSRSQKLAQACERAAANLDVVAPLSQRHAHVLDVAGHA